MSAAAPSAGPTVCATVDVEDFYEGMAVLGSPVAEARRRRGDGLASLLGELTDEASAPKVTLFVVGRYADQLRGPLADFAAAGHEIASHGPDHGRLPPSGLVDWLRRGRDMLEQVLQAPVRGFRSPRFDVPDAGLASYRAALAEAGYTYVSDSSFLGVASPVAELPVLTWRGVRVGGGSYQRFLPGALVAGAVHRSAQPAVVYYHSYDFDGSLPGLGAVRSAALARQLVARGRIRAEFRRITARFGSRTCADVTS
ncbi:MAG TPA: DUF3473 domain-containing protein [Acidimicrobiales bacterium]|nr:DUF3473 domain-containing protein [Acidimicrobiales bacterium]